MTQRPFLTRNGVSMRPVQLTDASFIIKERRAPRARAFLGDTKECIQAQCEWIKKQQAKKNDYYFVCQASDGQPLGTVGVYEIHRGEAEWGRFLIKPAYNAALQTLSLLFDFCFDELQLHRLRCKVVVTNSKARQLYEWIGHIESTRHTAPPAIIAGQTFEQIFYTLDVSQWRASRPKVVKAASRVQLVRDKV